jgi:sortase (surface protein transpeptidase)
VSRRSRPVAAALLAIMVTACGGRAAPAPEQVRPSADAFVPGEAPEPGTDALEEGDAVLGLGAASDDVGRPAAEPAAAQPVLGPLSARMPDGRQTTEPSDGADALGIEIPAIGVRSYLVRLGKAADGAMEVPDDYGLAGWYVHGPKPGEPGPLVVAGHVDSRTRGAVFLRLRTLAEGDVVHVHRADGQVATYVVDRVEQHPKTAFPTEAVFGNTAGPELRLITCGGSYDRRAGSHRDNVIVFARLAA